VWLDLANDRWEAVRVTENGWEIVAEPTARFRRPKNMAALPRPGTGGRIETLRRFVNVGTAQQWILLVAWVLGVLYGTGPYPMLVLLGEQGSAKSTLARVLRHLLDPVHKAPTRRLPNNEQELLVSAVHSAMLAFDNVSNISSAISDALCRIATGAGTSTRQLYSDAEEFVIGVVRPICLNGIEEFIRRPDLLDRCIVLRLPSITPEVRRAERIFWSQFNDVLPEILGAFLTSVSVGLRNLPQVHLERSPRMADFARWIVACEPALPWNQGEFLNAYEANIADATQVGIESSASAQALLVFMQSNERWRGEATELLRLLQPFSTEGRVLPASGQALSQALRRVAPLLRSHRGIEITFGIREGQQGTRLIEIVRRLTQTDTAFSDPRQR